MFTVRLSAAMNTLYISRYAHLPEFLWSTYIEAEFLSISGCKAVSDPGFNLHFPD